MFKIDKNVEKNNKQNNFDSPWSNVFVASWSVDACEYRNVRLRQFFSILERCTYRPLISTRTWQASIKNTFTSFSYIYFFVFSGEVFLEIEYYCIIQSKSSNNTSTLVLKILFQQTKNDFRKNEIA